MVGSTRRRLVGGSGGTTVLGLLVAVKATGATEEDDHLVVEDVLAGLGVLGGDAGADNGRVALVDDVEELGAGDETSGRGDGELADLEVLLAVEEHHGVEVGDEGVVAEGGLGGEGGDDTVGWEDLEVLGTLEDVLELVGLGTNTQVVEDGVTVLVLELGLGTLLVKSLLDGIEVLVACGSGFTLMRQKRISTLEVLVNVLCFTFLTLEIYTKVQKEMDIKKFLALQSFHQGGVCIYLFGVFFFFVWCVGVKRRKMLIPGCQPCSQCSA